MEVSYFKTNLPKYLLSYIYLCIHSKLHQRVMEGLIVCLESLDTDRPPPPPGATELPT